MTSKEGRLLRREYFLNMSYVKRVNPRDFYLSLKDDYMNRYNYQWLYDAMEKHYYE